MSSSTGSSTTDPRPLPDGTVIRSPSGKSYTIDGNLREGRHSHVYRATHAERLYVLKEVIPGEFDSQVSLEKRVEHSSHVRTAIDTIPDRYLLVYPHLEDSLYFHKWPLSFAPAAKKKLLRDALSGLADLHDQRIIHTDIGPENIMMDFVIHDDGTLDPQNVQITDLEGAYTIPPNRTGIHKRAWEGHLWRSPEAWAKARLDTPSDIFSFGLVAIFAWLNVKFLFSWEVFDVASPEELMRLSLRLHLCHFGDDAADLSGFIKYHGDGGPFVDLVFELLGTFDDQNPRLPFHLFTGPAVEPSPQFLDLVGKMVCLDPLRRITAREALQHPWFAE
ncbi:hypothetical protein RB595_010751 [Gaeumannomyces hyphopodioides]